MVTVPGTPCASGAAAGGVAGGVFGTGIQLIPDGDRKTGLPRASADVGKNPFQKFGQLAPGRTETLTRPVVLPTFI
jgi:hypothetical protein